MILDHTRLCERRTPVPTVCAIHIYLHTFIFLYICVMYLMGFSNSLIIIQESHKRDLKQKTKVMKRGAIHESLFDFLDEDEIIIDTLVRTMSCQMFIRQHLFVRIMEHLAWDILREGLANGTEGDVARLHLTETMRSIKGLKSFHFYKHVCTPTIQG